MNRRTFLGAAAALPVALRGQGEGPSGPPVESAVEKMTAGDHPTVATSHVGYRPHVGRKIVIIRNPTSPYPKEFTIRGIDSQRGNNSPSGGNGPRPLTPVRCDLGTFLIGDFTDIDRPGMYQVGLRGERVPLREVSERGVSNYAQGQGGERSVPFVISEDAWRRTIPKAVSYIHSQRCGVAVPGVHPPCHLDDARLDNGRHIDAVGGWHDAGDVRKGIVYTALMGVGLLKVLQNLKPAPGDVSPEQVLDEVRHGNKYFLKMQDQDRKVWSGTGTNEWTDNVIGTADDRPVNTSRKPEATTAVFATLQALAAQCYRTVDGEYANGCLDAGVRAFKTLEKPGTMADDARWAIAACELYRATRKSEYRDKALQLGRDLLLRQNLSFLGDQKQIRGFWMEGEKPFVHLVDGGLPPLAVAELCHTFPDAADRKKWMEALQLHVNEYVMPMAERSPYRIMPVGVYDGSPTRETYRPLAGRLTYRYFMPVREKYWWLGTSSHLLSHALFLGRFAQLMGDKGKPYVELAYRQMEWIMGSNPFGACLMTGVGARNPMPYSVFVGPIIGGVLNGIGGNTADEPVLNPGPDNDWRTGEYWSPHNAYYLWANSVLEQIT
jgi:hypothetical protein